MPALPDLTKRAHITPPQPPEQPPHPPPEMPPPDEPAHDPVHDPEPQTPPIELPPGELPPEIPPQHWRCATSHLLESRPPRHPEAARFGMPGQPAHPHICP